MNLGFGHLLALKIEHQLHGLTGVFIRLEVGEDHLLEQAVLERVERVDLKTQLIFPVSVLIVGVELIKLLIESL